MGVGPEHLEETSCSPSDLSTLGRLVSELAHLNDEDWVDYAFLHEPMRGRLDWDDRRNLSAKAAECGRRQAQECIERFGTQIPSELVAPLGLTMGTSLEDTDALRVLFAEYVASERSIRICEDAVGRATRLLDQAEVAQAFGGPFRIREVLVGHELYHAIEVERGVWTQTYRLPLWKVGPLGHSARVSCLSEVAAMSFTRCLNGLDWSPYVLDVLLTYEYSERAALGLYDEMRS